MLKLPLKSGSRQVSRLVRTSPAQDMTSTGMWAKCMKRDLKDLNIFNAPHKRLLCTPKTNTKPCVMIINILPLFADALWLTIRLHESYKTEGNADKNEGQTCYNVLDVCQKNATHSDENPGVLSYEESAVFQPHLILAETVEVTLSNVAFHKKRRMEIARNGRLGKRMLFFFPVTSQSCRFVASWLSVSWVLKPGNFGT